MEQSEHVEVLLLLGPLLHLADEMSHNGRFARALRMNSDFYSASVRYNLVLLLTSIYYSVAMLSHNTNIEL